MKLSEIDILPCPFCGCTELHDSTWYLDEGEVDALECSQCFAGAPTTAWNARCKEATLDIEKNQDLST